MKNIIDFSDKKKNTNEAASWLLKLERDGGLSASEKHEINNWLEQSPSNIDDLKRLSSVWSDANVLTELAVPIPRPVSIKESLFGSEFSRQYGALAASLLIAIAIISLSFMGSYGIVQKNGVIVTEVGTQKTIALADGSTLKLNTDSRVRIDYTDEFRNIFLLSGEAHFIVAKNKDRPFRVYAANGRIHAIGTAFSVYLSNGEVDVTVSEGRVGIASVAEQYPRTSVSKSAFERPIKSLGMLRAGEVGTIIGNSTDNEEFTLRVVSQVTDIDIAKRISWTNGVLIFAGEPLEEVVSEISRYTDVNIEFSDPELKKIRIGGTFPVGETEAMFSSLETSFGLQVTRLNSDRIVISNARESK